MTAFKITALLCMLAVSIAYAQTDKNNIVIGTKETHYSKVLHEKREIWVHVPGNVKRQQTDIRYPVVYVLDGEQHFYSVTGLVHQMSQSTGNTSAPPMIIVSILSPDRTRDFTPTHYTSGFGTDSIFARTSGGSEAFIAYLQKELMPHIDSVYPTAPYRTFIGHSLGGLLVVNTLLHHPALFNAYVALEPSLWWDGNLMLKQAKEVSFDPAAFNNKSFYMAVGNTMNSDADTAVMRKDTTYGSLPFRAQLDFADILKAKNSTNGLRSSHGYYKKDGHTSITLIGMYDALHFIFDFHKASFADRMWDAAFNSDSAIRSHYRMISSRMGYTVHPPRELLNELGHVFLQFGMDQKAEELFKINLDNYPRNAESHAALGDFFAAKKDAKTAASHYQKSLLLKNDVEVRKRLNTLTAKK